MLSGNIFKSNLLNCTQINSTNFNIVSLVSFKARLHVISEVVRWKQLSIRKSFSHALTKGQVSGTGKKPFAQKGRGQARQGSLRNPHQRGGGVAFPPCNHSYQYKMNKKKRHLALKSILLSRFKTNKIIIFDNFILKKPSTQTIYTFLQYFNLTKTLIVDFPNPCLQLSVRNMRNSKFMNIKNLNTIEILKKPHLLITSKAFSYILSFF